VDLGIVTSGGHASTLQNARQVTHTGSAQAAPPLEVQDFGRRYSRARPWAVRGVTFTLPDGSVTALVGPNGAGKSTLLRACVGFEAPDQGRIMVFGADPQRNRREAISNTGFVPQRSALYQGLSIEDHFVLARTARPHFDVAYATRRVEDAGLTVRRRAGDLSGGERAQVSLALALGTRAHLLVLDEPLAALDPLARREFLNALTDHIRQQGGTALLSSHIVTDVEHVCDRLVVLGDGRLLLHADIATARRQFATVPVSVLGGRPAVGTFATQEGLQVALVRSAGDSSTPLEGIVLGHLASSRKRHVEDAT